MCFNDDYDWHAESETITAKPASDPTRCGECREPIAAGELAHFIEMEQYESCYTCREAECSCPKDKDGDCKGCECETPEFGETFSFVMCDGCKKLRQAIHAVEIEEGCSHPHTEPAYGEMIEMVRDNGDDDKYLARAAQDFPELQESGYMTRMAKLLA